MYLLFLDHKAINVEIFFPDGWGELFQLLGLLHTEKTPNIAKSK